MASRWETTNDGRLKLTISPDGGGPASVFYGDTKEEIYDKVVIAQANANGRIHELRMTPPNGGGSPPPASHPKALSPGERMETVSDLTNPAKAPEAIVKVVESRIGRSLDQMAADNLLAAQTAAAEAFTAQTPDWPDTEYNRRKMVSHMRSQGYDLANIEHYKRAYAELSAAQLLQPAQAPAQDGNAPEDGLHQPNAENPAPPRPQRRFSTGIRSSDVSGSAPMPTKRLKYTREQTTNISAAEYKRLMLSDPEFSRCVEFYSKPQARRAATA